LDLQALSAMVGRQLGLMSIIVPFWLVVAQAGWRGMLEVWPACLVTGLSFGTSQFLVSNLHGPWLVGIISAFVSMGSLVALMRFWKPVQEGMGDNEHQPESEAIGSLADSEEAPYPWKPWLPWILLSVLVFVWGLPSMKNALNMVFSPNLPVPWLDNSVQRMPPIVPSPTAEHATFTFNALSATGTALLLAGVFSGFFLGFSPARLFGLYWRTLLSVRISLLTIALMLALGFTTRYSGTDTTLGLALASTGILFPFFSPLIGWLGVALTGSDTSSNVLFGNLQQVTAQRLNLSPILTASANSSGGVMGKMIDAQSIVVASVATGGHPKSPDAGTVLRSVFWHSLALATLVGIMVVLQAYVWPS